MQNLKQKQYTKIEAKLKQIEQLCPLQYRHVAYSNLCHNENCKKTHRAQQFYPCFFYFNGGCKNSFKCNFNHMLSVKRDSKVKPCLYYIMGNCPIQDCNSYHKYKKQGEEKDKIYQEVLQSLQL